MLKLKAWLRGFKLPVFVTLLLCLPILAGLGWYFFETEGYLSNAIHMMALGAAMISALVFLTRRPFASAVFFASLVAVIAITAYVKFEALTFTLHMWDFVYYARDWMPVFGWWFGRPAAMLAIIGALASLIVGTWLAWRLEKPSIGRRWAFLSMLLMAALSYTAVSIRGHRPHVLFNFPDWHVSSFFASSIETAEALRRGGMIETAQRSNAKPFESSWTCKPEKKPPHIILIHQESVGPPMFFPQVTYDPMILPLFNSFDGKLHKLNVETYGGASWISESAVMLGLSSRYFGSMKDFIQFFMAGRVKDSMPQILEKCGYRNIMFYPYIFGTFGNKSFFETIGVREVFDRKSQGAKLDWDTDRFYYDNMLKEIGKHVAGSQKPLFTFLETMSAHWPYNYEFEPQIKVPSGGPNNHPEMNEYLRRLAMARIDLDYLKEQLRTRFPDESFLLVQYGDHHAIPTAYLYGYDTEDGVQDMKLPEGYPLYTTYYSVDGVNYTPPPLPNLDSVDIAFAGAIFLDAARLPLPESWRERLRLMQVCAGLAWNCKQRDEMLKFHRRLIESGLMQNQ